MANKVYGSNTIKTSINKEIKVSDLISLNPTSDKGGDDQVSKIFKKEIYSKKTM